MSTTFTLPVRNPTTGAVQDLTIEVAHAKLFVRLGPVRPSGEDAPHHAVADFTPFIEQLVNALVTQAANVRWKDLAPSSLVQLAEELEGSTRAPGFSDALRAGARRALAHFLRREADRRLLPSEPAVKDSDS